MAEAFIITTYSERFRSNSYWQTPYFVRERVMQDGAPLYENGRPVFARDENGNFKHKPVGGWVGKAEYATKYRTQEEAEFVNAIRSLGATVERW
jgi:hypothetical protein